MGQIYADFYNVGAVWTQNLNTDDGKYTDWNGDCPTCDKKTSSKDPTGSFLFASFQRTKTLENIFVYITQAQPFIIKCVQVT